LTAILGYLPVTRVVSVLAAACLLVAGLAAPARGAAFDTGLSGVLDYGPEAYAQVHSAGASFVRIGVPWAAIAPEQRRDGFDPASPAEPSYRWGHVDEGVVNSVAAGLTPVLTITTAPAWASGCSAPNAPEAACDPDPAALAQFATAMAKRYSGSFGRFPRVRYFQGPNEPNISYFFLPQFETNGRPVSATLYRQLINEFYTAIKAVDPSNLVLAGGLAPVAAPKLTIAPMRFTRELLCMSGGQKPRPKPGCEAGVHFDIFDIHPYTSGSPTHKGRASEVQMGQLRQLVDLLRAADRAGHIDGAGKRTPLWITEFSYDTKPPDPNGLAMKIAARWMCESMYRAWQAGIDHFFWFGLRDLPRYGLSYAETTQSGLFFRGPSVQQDKPKRIFYAFRFPFVAYGGDPHPGTLSVWGRTPTSRPGKVRIQVLTDARWRTVRTLRTDRHGLFRARLKTSYGSDHQGSARAIFDGVASVPFSMKPVPDFVVSPFG